MKKKYVFLFFIIVILIFLKHEYNFVAPIILSSKHICANDGMIVIDFKGPKAQILWRDGSVSFYCEVREAFYEWNDIIKRQRIRKFFVQDFSSVKWGSYVGNWTEACKAVYVIDSFKYGSIGISYIPFSDIVYANLFLNKYHGILVNFNDISIDLLDKSNDLLKDRMIDLCVNN